MLATMEQTTADLPASLALEKAMLPTITYNKGNHSVNITVIVSRLESDSLRFGPLPSFSRGRKRLLPSPGR